MSVIAVITLLDTLLMLATEIPTLFAKASVLREELQIFVDEDREPTVEEWEIVNTNMAGLLAFLDDRAEEARAHLAHVQSRT